MIVIALPLTLAEPTAQWITPVIVAVGLAGLTLLPDRLGHDGLPPPLRRLRAGRRGTRIRGVRRSIRGHRRDDARRLRPTRRHGELARDHGLGRPPRRASRRAPSVDLPADPQVLPRKRLPGRRPGATDDRRSRLLERPRLALPALPGICRRDARLGALRHGRARDPESASAPARGGRRKPVGAAIRIRPVGRVQGAGHRRHAGACRSAPDPHDARGSVSRGMRCRPPSPRRR